MRQPTNNRQKQLCIGVLRGLFKSRMAEKDYIKANEINLEIKKLEKLTFKEVK